MENERLSVGKDFDISFDGFDIQSRGSSLIVAFPDGKIRRFTKEEVAGTFGNMLELLRSVNRESEISQTDNEIVNLPKEVFDCIKAFVKLK